MRRVIQIMTALASLSVTASPTLAQRPTGYPRSYDQLIADARAERQVVVYANADTAEMAPVRAAAPVPETSRRSTLTVRALVTASAAAA